MPSDGPPDGASERDSRGGRPAPRDLPPPPPGPPASSWSPASARPPPPPPPAAPPRSAPTGPRRLHPFSIVRGIPLRQAVTGLLPVAVALGSLGRAGPATVAVLVVVVLPAVRVAAWRRQTYEVRDDRIIERKGVLNRQERTLELARVQQVEIARTLLDRLVGTAELRLETAGEAGESELALRVVSETEARRLRRVLRPRDARPAAADRDDDPHGTVVVAVPLRHVVLAAVTGSRLLIVPAVIAGLYGILGDLRLADRATDELGRTVGSLTAAGAVLAAGAILVFGFAAAAATGVLRDGGFVIRDRDGDLHVRRGPVTTREAVVPRTRLQRVAVDRSWLRRWLGFATVTLFSAGGAGGRDDEARDRRLTIPLVPAAAVEPLVRTLLGVPAELPRLEAHPARARRRAVVRRVWRLGPLAAAVTAGAATVQPVYAVAGMVVLAAAVPLGLLEHRHLASARSPDLLLGRRGALNLATAVVPRTKIQGMTLAASPFQRRLRLASVRVHVAGPGGGATLVDLERDVASDWTTAVEVRDPRDRRH